jgi:hypothetical protein
MGAPVGNKNNAKGKQWESAIKRALARAHGTVDQGLDRVADKLVAAAVEGDRDARTEIGNRMDGKPSEYVYLEQDLTINAGDSDSLKPKFDVALAKRQSPTVQ